MNRSSVAAGVLGVLASSAVLVVVHEWSQPPEAYSQARVCRALASVQEGLDLSSLGEQASLPARAARLADLLSVGEGDDRAAAGRIIVVLDDSRASVADLAEAIEPVAGLCP